MMTKNVASENNLALLNKLLNSVGNVQVVAKIMESMKVVKFWGVRASLFDSAPCIFAL